MATITPTAPIRTAPLLTATATSTATSTARTDISRPRELRARRLVTLITLAVPLALTIACSQPSKQGTQPGPTSAADVGVDAAVFDTQAVDATSSLDVAAAPDTHGTDTYGTDTLTSDVAPEDVATNDIDEGDDAATSADAQGSDGAADAGSSTPADPCDGQTCSGHGSCFTLYDQPRCSCDKGYYLVDQTQCRSEATGGPCFPNPCKVQDKTSCSESGGKAICGCDIGFSPQGSLCVFATCPKISAVTGITLYDQTGGSVAGGFDPLKVNDIVKIRVDIRVESGSAAVTLVLQPDNTELLTDRLAFNGKKVTTFKKKGNLLEVPLQLSPGDHSVELQGKLLTGLAPMSLNARLTAPGACELPKSRSGARIGPLGLLDAKGFGCVNLDRNRSVQVTAEVVEKSTSVYGSVNGTNSNYSPAGKIVATVTQCFLRNSDQVIFLAGDALGEQPWGVDNYFVIEVFDHPPKKTEKPAKALVLQASEAVKAVAPIVKIHGPHGDVSGIHIGVPNGAPFGWSAGHVRITDLIPKGKQTWLRFYALDHGVVGRLTRVYLHSREPTLAPPACVNNAGCDHLGKGCVDGQCVGAPCSGTCPGKPGQFCVGGFCTSQCNKGGGSCPSGQTCAVRSCVAASTSGLCDPAKYDQDCPKGQTCHLGRCTVGCHHPRKQDQSYKLTSGFCKTAGLCPHCPKAKQGCWNNVCAECSIDPHCPSGTVCVNRSCVVWP